MVLKSVEDGLENGLKTVEDDGLKIVINFFLD